MNKINPSCSMCQHFDPLRNKCAIYDEAVEANDTKKASQCKKEGNFVREFHVLPDYFNIYANPEDAPFGWEPDFSKVPKDKDGNPLVVVTNRGYERALPAYEGAELTVAKESRYVPLWATYQGQREMVYELGYEIAKKAVEDKGYELHTLPGEEDYEGFDKYKRHFLYNKKIQNKKQVLLTDEPIEAWD